MADQRSARVGAVRSTRRDRLAELAAAAAAHAEHVDLLLGEARRCGRRSRRPTCRPARPARPSATISTPARRPSGTPVASMTTGGPSPPRPVRRLQPGPRRGRPGKRLAPRAPPGVQAASIGSTSRTSRRGRARRRAAHCPIGPAPRTTTRSPLDTRARDGAHGDRQRLDQRGDGPGSSLAIGKTCVCGTRGAPEAAVLVDADELKFAHGCGARSGTGSSRRTRSAAHGDPPAGLSSGPQPGSDRLDDAADLVAEDARERPPPAAPDSVPSKKWKSEPHMPDRRRARRGARRRAGRPGSATSSITIVPGPVVTAARIAVLPGCEAERDPRGMRRSRRRPGGRRPRAAGSAGSA